ncbi:undecaprenyldiphospho-muramoylpentapeptide beta-N-acetylglucosaminyltransferase [Bacillus infantis]|uniref:undecaprenyldiphospho-muramoylpentapeptide beta-N-acetylglucosaminyltransferase n=1 Tax=Bacillus infantis TaxID=324767 RepID=UPI0021557CD4|nr:undecaprenyldiphospho-muramoylpentapeptide beta-N-acetylglucosaminyltransferase [Bacillus infantis]MCR6610889.1 undecaprenyldiphospho-muramoylpentapeptide beta-N-acetylglucosaminyltransferase [Bacillus infantis]
MKKTLVLTGGGSAGHVTPNMALIKELEGEDVDIHYIGSREGIEKELISGLSIPYHSISSGKLRRYADFENVKDMFRVAKGCSEALLILKKLKPALVFSKGGFVSVPVIMAAKLLRIPIFIHESDLTPGLANRISKNFASKIYTSFEETLQYLPTGKARAIGSPIRREILSGIKEKGLEFLGFNKSRPVLAIMGGSLGAKKINEAVRQELDQIGGQFQIVHLCGKGNLDPALEGRPGYRQFEFLNSELSDVLACTDMMITRGGSNAIFEFLALRIPMLIIPLSKKQSRGDQILNAGSFEKKGYSLTLQEEELTAVSLAEHIGLLNSQRESIAKKKTESGMKDALSVMARDIRDKLQQN